MRAIRLGDEVRDIITGFEGVVIGQVQALFGTDKCEVQQRGLNQDSRPFESIWIPTAQLEITKKSIVFDEDHCHVTEEELREASKYQG